MAAAKTPVVDLNAVVASMAAIRAAALAAAPHAKWWRDADSGKKLVDFPLEGWNDVGGSKFGPYGLRVNPKTGEVAFAYDFVSRPKYRIVNAPGSAANTYVLSGGIDPLLPEDVAEVNAERARKATSARATRTIEARNKGTSGKVNLNIKEFAGASQPVVDKDGITILSRPDDSHASNLFRFGTFMSEIYRGEFNEYLQRGEEYATAIRKAKEANPAASAAEARAAAEATVGPVPPGSAILTSTDMGKISAAFPRDSASIKALTAGLFQPDNAKLCTPNRTQLSAKNERYPNADLPNGSVSLVIREKKAQAGPGAPASAAGPAQLNCLILNKLRPISTRPPTFEPYTVDGVPADTANAHKVFKYGTEIDGVFGVDIVASNLGLSMIFIASALVVTTREAGAGIGVADIYGFDEADYAAAPSAAEVEHVAAPAASYDDALNDI